MKKVLLFIISSVLFLFLGFASVVKGKNIEVNGLQSNQAIVMDENGDIVSNENTDMWSNYKVSYNWSILNDIKIKKGDIANVYIPENVKVNSNYTINLKNKEGVIVGVFNIKKGENVGVITFNDYYEKHDLDNRKGTLSFWCRGIKEQIHENYVVNKAGWLAGDNEVGWSVLYNPNSEELHNVVIKDTLEGKQTYKSDIVVEYGKVENGKFVSEKSETFKPQNNNSFEFKKDVLNQTIRFTYYTELKGDADSVEEMKNNAETKDDVFGNNSCMASVQVGGDGTAGGDNKPIIPSTKPTHEESSTIEESTTEESATTGESTTTENSISDTETSESDESGTIITTTTETNVGSENNNSNTESGNTSTTSTTSTTEQGLGNTGNESVVNTTESITTTTENQTKDNGIETMESTTNNTGKVDTTNKFKEDNVIRANNGVIEKSIKTSENIANKKEEDKILGLLPKTGNKKSIYLVMIGVAIVGLALWFIIYRKIKK